MLTHEEHQAMIMFDRLLMAAKDNETIADLLDQTLNVTRMIDPSPDEKVTYGPLQRMHFEWQQLKYRMSELDKKMDQYLNQQNRYGGTYPNTGNTGYSGYATGIAPSIWPSNPGLDISTGYGAIPPSSFSDLNKYSQDFSEKKIDYITEKLRKLAEDAKDAK